MGRQKIRQLTLGAWSVIFLAVFFIVFAASWALYHFFPPFPPNTLVLATGMEGGSFSQFGELYRRALAREGIHVVLYPTSGAVENMKLLEDRSQPVQAGFVQGTVGRIDDSAKLVSIGGLGYMPLWIFYRGADTYTDLSQLKGKRIAIGPEGSAVRQFALVLLKAAGVTGPPAEFAGIPYNEANQALLGGRVDAIMVFGSPDNRLVLEMLNMKGVKLMNMSQAEAYTRRFIDLSHVVLPRGVIDLAKRKPSSDIHLLSPTTNLIVRKELHPALVYLLLKASAEIHGGATWINKAGEFPTIKKQDDPISEQAERFYRSGGSWFYAYFPYWAATFAEKLVLILIPLGVILVPLIGIAPWIYTWRNRSKYYPWYRELRNLEKAILEDRSVENYGKYEKRLDGIEAAVDRIRTSVAFYDELYILKEHIQIVRLKLESLLRLQEKTDSPGRKGEGAGAEIQRET